MVHRPASPHSGSSLAETKGSNAVSSFKVISSNFGCKFFRVKSCRRLCKQCVHVCSSSQMHKWKGFQSCCVRSKAMFLSVFFQTKSGDACNACTHITIHTVHVVSDKCNAFGLMHVYLCKFNFIYTMRCEELHCDVFHA